jgi:hypothetical protein
VRSIDDPLQLPHAAREWRAYPGARRQLGHGRFAQAHRSRAPRALFPTTNAANLNIVRNWMGNNDEDVRLPLRRIRSHDPQRLLGVHAGFQVEPQIRSSSCRTPKTRCCYRNHPPSCCGSGETKEPAPILNEGWGSHRAADGTRHFTGSSNMVNLQGSGPYNYRTPLGCFRISPAAFGGNRYAIARHARGHPGHGAEGRWPLSDTIAYHDWHFGGTTSRRSWNAGHALWRGKASKISSARR